MINTFLLKYVIITLIISHVGKQSYLICQILRLLLGTFHFSSMAFINNLINTYLMYMKNKTIFNLYLKVTEKFW